MSRLVAGRLVKLQFKEGKSEIGFYELDLILNKQTRNAKGFRGYVSMFSCDQKDAVIILTIWEDDESFMGSMEMFSAAMEKVAPLLERTPSVEHCRVDTVILNQ